MTNWYALPLGDVLARLGTTPSGLDEAKARARLARYGPNALAAAPPRVGVEDPRRTGEERRRPPPRRRGRGVALLLGDRADGAAIGVVLLLNISLGFATELRARRAMEALLALQVARASVVRDGRPRVIDARELVPGDVIEVEAGQAAPADARLIHASELRTTEAALTGESLPVEKRADVTLRDETPLPDRRNMLYQATSVAAGAGRAVVVATGMTTEVGRLGALVAGIAETRRRSTASARRACAR